MKVAFFGSSEFSIRILKEILNGGHQVVSFYFNGTYAPKCAFVRGLNIKRWGDFENEEFDVGVVASFGKRIPSCLLSQARLAFLNVHPSLLPRHRGPAPIHRALMNGDKVTGVTVIEMTEEIDKGPVLLQKETAIFPWHDRVSLELDLQGLGALALRKVLEDFRTYHGRRTEQKESEATYAPKVAPEETRIDWTWTNFQVDRRIRGLSFSPGAWSTLQGFRVKFFQSALSPFQGNPGTMLCGQHEPLIIACGEGAVEIPFLQREGRRMLNSAAFMRGVRLEEQSHFI